MQTRIFTCTCTASRTIVRTRARDIRAPSISCACPYGRLQVVLRTCIRIDASADAWADTLAEACARVLALVCEIRARMFALMCRCVCAFARSRHTSFAHARACYQTIPTIIIMRAHNACDDASRADALHAGTCMTYAHVPTPRAYADAWSPARVRK
jgi:hypothetical protein